MFRWHALFCSPCSGPFAVNCRICVWYRLRFKVFCAIEYISIILKLLYLLAGVFKFFFFFTFSDALFLWWFGCRSHLLVIDMLQTAHATHTQSNIPISILSLTFQMLHTFLSAALLHIRMRKKKTKTISMDQIAHTHTHTAQVCFTDEMETNSTFLNISLDRRWIYHIFCLMYLFVSKCNVFCREHLINSSEFISEKKDKIIQLNVWMVNKSKSASKSHQIALEMKTSKWHWKRSISSSKIKKKSIN